MPNEEYSLLRPPLSPSHTTNTQPPASGMKTFRRLAVSTTLGALLATSFHLAPMPNSAAPASAATNLLVDSMDSALTSGWGSPEIGSVYSVNAASRFSKSQGIGAVKILPGKNSYATSTLKESDVAAKVDVSFDSIPQSGSVYAHVALRHSVDSRYETSLRLTSTGKLTLEVSKTIAGKKTVIDSHLVASKATAGQAYRVEFTVTGSHSPVLKARAYSGSLAPQWQIMNTQAGSAVLSKAGALRLGGYLSAAATKSTGIHVDNLQVSAASELNTAKPQPLEPDDQPLANAEPLEVDLPPLGQPQSPTPAPTPEAEQQLPAGALYVSTQGASNATGTVKAPLRSIGEAIAKAKSGQRVVVRAGSYHESLTVPAGKKLHLRNYPGEKVWLDGSSAVTGFTSSSTGYSTAWKYDFDSSPTYTRGANDNKEEAWGFVSDSHPMAAHPEQVWVDGTRQKQVKSLSSLEAGTFHVDKAANKLTLGSNPAGKSVRASTLVKALSIRADGSSVDGINIRKFAPSVPDMGAVTAEKPGIIVKNLTVEDSATTGINVSAVNNQISNVNIKRSGMLGMNAVYSDGLKVNALNASSNNMERFNSSPVSGGLKITRSRNIAVTNSTMANNNGPGLWIDESVYNSKILNNDMTDNTGHGLSLEISAKAVVANNRIINNGGNGIKLNNSSDVDIWNNTISGKNRVLNIVQDKRRGANKSDPGHDPRQAFPDATMPWIIKNVAVKNNVLSNTGGGNAIVAIEDYSRQLTAEQMKISLDSNAYHRTGSTNPNWSAVWSNAAANPSVYTTLSDFQKAEKQDLSSFEVTAPTVLNGIYQPTSAVSGKASKATALPSSVASLILQSAGSKHLGAFPR